ncbi:MAG: GNAT family N-acetyltransferase [Flavobacteriales bacterium]
MQFLQRHQIDDEKWNEVVRSSDRFRHYALTYFLDAVTVEWSAFVGDNYEWVWPVPIKRSPVPQVYQPLLAQQLGPYFTESISEGEIEMVWKELKSNYWRLNVKFSDHFKAIPFEVGRKHINVELALDSEYDTLTKNYKRNAVSNIRKAEQAELVISVDEEYQPEIVKQFKLGKGKEVNELDEAFYAQVQSIYEAFAGRNESETWVASIDGKFLAGIMLLKTNNRLLNFFTGNAPDAREVGAMHFLFDAIIKRYANSASALDFEGSNDENLAYFYKSFGGSEKVYLQAQTGWMPPLIKKVLG